MIPRRWPKANASLAPGNASSGDCAERSENSQPKLKSERAPAFHAQRARRPLSAQWLQ